MEYEYRVIYSRRRTLGISITNDGQLTVRAPCGTSKREIERMLREKADWIEKHLAESKKRNQAAEDAGKLTFEQIKALGEEAVRVIPERVKHYAPLIGVQPRGMTIRNQKTRWGSCSSNGRLNFNCLLMLAPREVLDSVVVHELCHLKEMNHSDRFYAEVYRVFPEYDRCSRWLKTDGKVLLARMG